MVSKEMKLLMGEDLYKLKKGEELYARAENYLDKYSENDDKESGQIFLNYAYASFMEGYVTENICHDIAVMVTRGFLLPGHNKRESVDISSAMLQYGVEQFQSSICAYQLYWRYEDGTSGIIQANSNLAWQWLQRAAQLGHMDAQFSLGLELYRSNKKYDAEEWWIESAEQGRVDAMRNLGVLYEDDWDYSKAGYWFEQAASNGDEDAEEHLRKNYVYNQRSQKWLKRM